MPPLRTIGDTNAQIQALLTSSLAADCQLKAELASALQDSQIQMNGQPTQGYFDEALAGLVDIYRRFFADKRDDPSVVVGKWNSFVQIEITDHLFVPELLVHFSDVAKTAFNEGAMLREGVLKRSRRLR